MLVISNLESSLVRLQRLSTLAPLDDIDFAAADEIRSASLPERISGARPWVQPFEADGDKIGQAAVDPQDGITQICKLTPFKISCNIILKMNSVMLFCSKFVEYQKFVSRSLETSLCLLLALGESSPLMVLLRILQALMNGTNVDIAAVHWLWVRLASGEFPFGAFPSHVPSLTLQGVEQEVGESLVMLLGSKETKQRSPAGSDVEEKRRRSRC